jgi:hypothetical protein
MYVVVADEASGSVRLLTLDPRPLAFGPDAGHVSENYAQPRLSFSDTTTVLSVRTRTRTAPAFAGAQG